MKRRMIYICSPYAGNTEENTAFARQACGYATRQEAVPLAPHLLYPQILNDTVLEERETGIRLGLEILERCEELWICGDRMSAGMKREGGGVLALIFSYQHRDGAVLHQGVIAGWG